MIVKKRYTVSVSYEDLFLEDEKLDIIRNMTEKPRFIVIPDDG